MIVFVMMQVHEVLSSLVLGIDTRLCVAAQRATARINVISLTTTLTLHTRPALLALAAESCSQSLLPPLVHRLEMRR